MANPEGQVKNPVEGQTGRVYENEEVYDSELERMTMMIVVTRPGEILEDAAHG